MLPFRLLGVDSDNGSEFINWHLKRWCEQRQIQLTRGRPYKKDDNAHVEQKNWTHVRKLLGWERYDSGAAVEAINDLYRHELRLWMNLYLPSVKLVKKVRVGSKVRRVYDAAQTPMERVLAGAQAKPERVAELKQLRQSLDPFQLGKLIDQKLERIYGLANRRLSPKLTAENRGTPAKEKTPRGRRNGGSSVTFPMCRRANPRVKSVNGVTRGLALPVESARGPAGHGKNLRATKQWRRVSSALSRRPCRRPNTVDGSFSSFPSRSTISFGNPCSNSNTGGIDPAEIDHVHLRGPVPRALPMTALQRYDANRFDRLHQSSSGSVGGRWSLRKWSAFKGAAMV